MAPGGITTLPGDAAPVTARHLYIHGGFTGTDAKFSLCCPPEEEYQRRFFQATHQLLAGEEATARNVAFALASGGYSVQTNMGADLSPSPIPAGQSRLQLPRRLQLLPEPRRHAEVPPARCGHWRGRNPRATGQIPTGRFYGKMIVVECLLDGDALPWQADWYRKKVEAIEGSHVDRSSGSGTSTTPTTPTRRLQCSRPTAWPTRARCSTRSASCVHGSSRVSLHHRPVNTGCRVCDPTSEPST